MSPSPANPPVSPSIAAQQVPMAQYAQAQAQQGGGVGTGQSQSSMALVQSLLTGVGQDLERVAKVLVVDKPELIPILKQSVSALSMLMDEVTKSLAPDNGAATQNAPMPDSGAVSAAA